MNMDENKKNQKSNIAIHIHSRSIFYTLLLFIDEFFFLDNGKQTKKKKKLNTERKIFN